jgi:hypothetical protein
MVDIFQNLVRYFSRDPQPYDEPENSKQQQRKPLKFEDDIKALEGIYGDLHGKSITVELQDLLKSCPRERHRVDAYRGLCNELLEAFQCTLSVVSQKTKGKR